MLRQGPGYFGLAQSCWRLAALLQVCQPWLKLATLAGLWYLLYRLKIAYKCIRLHVQSPDEHYQAKLTLIQHCLTLYRPTKTVVLFQDECTIYSKASSAGHWQARRQEPRAELGLKAQQSFPIAARLDPYWGKVVYLLRNQFTLSARIAFYQHLVKQYPGCQIYLIQDNWPQHYHPAVLAALESANWPFTPHLPASWAQLPPQHQYQHLNLPIQPQPLPTYASWLNPIEKLWRWLKQDLIHKYPFTDNVTDLKKAVDTWLAQFRDASQQLLKYVGLQGNQNIYTPAMQAVFQQVPPPT